MRMCLLRSAGRGQMRTLDPLELKLRVTGRSLICVPETKHESFLKEEQALLTMRSISSLLNRLLLSILDKAALELSVQPWLALNMSILPQSPTCLRIQAYGIRSNR